MPKAFSRILPLLALTMSLTLSGFAAISNGPSVEDFKQALTARLLKLKPEGMSERQVLFQKVQAGSSGNFRVTALVRDYGAGYPPNRYYGETCVGKFDSQEFTMAPDGFGGWNVQGAMTPPSGTRQCQQNPSAGASSIPLASLSGTAATANAVATEPPVATTQGGAGGKVASGHYECWANGQARLLMNFTIKSSSQYTDSEGKNGNYSVDTKTGRINFKGGGLDGILPAGFFGIYYEPHGRPTVSFRNSGGTEVTYCEK
jgi:hypothetical protein